MPSGKKKPIDRRIRKTIGLLHQALGSLIRDKPYDDIVVQEILDRANVGRSTFYMHFRDKEDLLVSAIRDLLESVRVPMGARSTAGVHERIVGFSLPIFEHIYEHRHRGPAMMGARGRAIVHEHLRKVLAEQIAHDVKEHFPGKKAANRVPEGVLEQYLASTFILVLNWWVESQHPLPPKEAHAVFRTLSMPTLSAVLR